MSARGATVSRGRARRRRRGRHELSRRRGERRVAYRREALRRGRDDGHAGVAAAADPAYGRRRDLVADRVAEDGGMSRARAHALAYPRLDRGGKRPALEKVDVLLPGDADHDAQPVPGCGVQQGGRRDGVGADGVDAVRGHRREVALDLLGRRKLAAGPVRAKRAVGDAAQGELLVARVEELPLDARATAGRDCRPAWGRPRAGWARPCELPERRRDARFSSPFPGSECPFRCHCALSRGWSHAGEACLAFPRPGLPSDRSPNRRSDEGSRCLGLLPAASPR